MAKQLSQNEVIRRAIAKVVGENKAPQTTEQRTAIKDLMKKDSRMAKKSIKDLGSMLSQAEKKLKRGSKAPVTKSRNQEVMEQISRIANTIVQIPTKDLDLAKNLFSKMGWNVLR